MQIDALKDNRTAYISSSLLVGGTIGAIGGYVPPVNLDNQDAYIKALNLTEKENNSNIKNLRKIFGKLLCDKKLTPENEKFLLASDIDVDMNFDLKNTIRNKINALIEKGKAIAYGENVDSVLTIKKAFAENLPDVQKNMIYERLDNSAQKIKQIYPEIKTSIKEQLLSNDTPLGSAVANSYKKHRAIKYGIIGALCFTAITLIFGDFDKKIQDNK